MFREAVRLVEHQQVARTAVCTRSSGWRTARGQIRAEVLSTQEGIARAIEDGDPELAWHRMRRHLEALGALMR